MQGYPKEEFEKLFQLIEDFDPSKRKGIGWMPFVFDGEISAKDLDRFKHFKDYRDEFYKAAEQISVVNKLMSDPVFRKASIERKRSKDVDLEEDLRKYWMQRKKKMEESNNFLRLDPKRFFYPFYPRHNYILELIREIYNYLYVDRVVVHQSKKQALKSLKNIAKEIESLEPAIRHDPDIKGVGFALLANFDINKKIEKVESILTRERYSKDMQERYFVERMIKINKRYRGSPKVGGIMDLMYLPFFKRQYDISTINRIAARLASQNSPSED